MEEQGAWGLSIRRWQSTPSQLARRSLPTRRMGRPRHHCRLWALRGHTRSRQVVTQNLSVNDKGVPRVVTTLVANNMAHSLATMSTTRPLPSSPHWVPTTIDPGTDFSKRHLLTLSDPNCER